MLSDTVGAGDPIYSLSSLMSPRGIFSALQITKLAALVIGLLFKTWCTVVLSKLFLPLSERALAMRFGQLSQAAMDFQIPAP